LKETGVHGGKRGPGNIKRGKEGVGKKGKPKIWAERASRESQPWFNDPRADARPDEETKKNWGVLFTSASCTQRTTPRGEHQGIQGCVLELGGCVAEGK